MTNTWISDAMQAGLRFVGWPVKARSSPSGKAVGPTAEEGFYDFKSFASQAQKLMNFQNDFLMPLMEDLKKGRRSLGANREGLTRFVHKAQDLGLQCTHPALGDLASRMHGVGEKDFTSDKTYRDLVQLKLSIEEAERTMNGRMHELKRVHPRRPSKRS